MAGDAPEKKLRALLYEFYVRDPPFSLASDVENTGHTKRKLSRNKEFYFGISLEIFFLCMRLQFLAIAYIQDRSYHTQLED